MAERVRVREITNDEGNKLLRIVRRDSGSVVRWRRAQMVLLSAQAMSVPQIAKVAFTSEDRVREVLHNFNDDGFDSLDARYAGGRPPKFTLPQRREIKKIALSRPTDHDLPFSTWSLSKLAEFVVAEGVVDDISHEGLRALLREEGVSFQAIKTFKVSNDPDFETKKNRVLELYDIADGMAKPKRGDPTIVFCMDEFGPLNLQPHPGRQWASVAAGKGSLDSPRRRRRRATRGAHRDRARQLQSTPLHEEGPARRRVDGGQQRRARLRAVLRVMAQPDRGPVHRVALLRARRHRPRIPRGAVTDDPPLHRLAQPPRRRQGTT